LPENILFSYYTETGNQPQIESVIISIYKILSMYPGNYLRVTPIVFFTIAFIFCGCAASRFGSALAGEKLTMKIDERKDILTIKSFKNQDAPAFETRGLTGRGLDFTGVSNNLVSMATQAIKSIISNEQKKYSAEYQFGLSDLYFYDQLSDVNALDPTGIQFFGFTLVRTFKNQQGGTDTAFTATFELDTTNAFEIINNSTFRLRLKDFHLFYAKAKIAEAAEKKLNMDFEITFTTSYADEKGSLINNVTLGKFFLLIRQAPLDPTDKNYNSYYKGLQGQRLTGKCFVVPRSFGWHKEDGMLKPGFGQGAYGISIAVKENSKDVFTNKILIENTNIIIDAGRNQLQNTINTRLPKAFKN